jgi:hypothetical protein
MASYLPVDPLGIPLSLLALGAGVLILILAGAAYQKAYLYPQAQCKVIAKSLKESQASGANGNDITMYGTSFLLDVQPKGQNAFEAQADGHVITSTSNDSSGAEAFLNRYTVNESYPCWYDPIAHSPVILDRSLDSFAAWTPFLAAFVFMFVGLIILIASVVKIIKIVLLLGFIGLLIRHNQS